MIKRILKFSLLLVVAIVFICNISFAENNVKSIAIEVVVNDDGSAKITQKWSGTFDEGTECFLPIDTDDFEVSNLSVTMGNKNFKNIEWDINKSFEEKSYKCGINKTDTGVELCFGISKMGKNTYTFSYDVSRLVSAYSDYDGFNYTFVNPNMDYFPTNVEWKLKLKSGKKLTSNNCKISCSGYEGTAEIKNGIAVAKSIQSLNGNQYFDVTMQFDKGIIKTQTLSNNKSSLKSQIENAKLVTEYSKDTLVEDMDTVTFGSYPQSDITGNTKDPIEWIVLDRDEENKKALLFSKYILDCKPYNDEFKDVTWETCTIRKWLNNDFYNNAFNYAEKNKIMITRVNNNNNIIYGTYGGRNTIDNIFLLSIDETRHYYGKGIKEKYGYEKYNFYHIGKILTTAGTIYSKNVKDGQGRNLYVYNYEDYEKEYNWDLDNDKDYLSKYGDYKWCIGNSHFWLRDIGEKCSYATFGTIGGSIHVGGRSVINEKAGVKGVRPALWVSYGSEDDKNNTGTVNVDSNKNLENAYETWDDNMFNESSYTYNHKVARISAMLCEASYNTGKLKNMILNHFGFSNIQLYNYDINDSIVLDEYKGTNCFSISHKTTNDKTFLLVTVRGTNNIEEIKGDAIKRTWWDDIVNWFSGSTYNKNEHKMFNQCNVYDNVYDFYEQVEKGVYDYLSKYPSIKNAKNMKVLITGHSLGGAAANLYGAALAYDTQPLDNKYLKHEDIFTYTFGSIKVIEDIDTNIEEGYENIFDIYNHYDSFGPNGNYAVWGASHPYHKFGHTFTYKDERVHDSEFFLSFNNHNMTNYMAALNLCDFSKIRNTNQEEAAQEAKQNNGNNLKEQIRNAKLVTEYAEDTLVDNIDTVVFGSYPQSDITGNIKEPIEWIVLDRQEDKALLLSKYILDSAKFNDEINNLWETSSLRMWMNDYFYKTAFSESDRKSIILSHVSTENYKKFGTEDERDTRDYVFAISISEAVDYLKNEKRLNTKATNYVKYNKGIGINISDSWRRGSSGFWLRSPGYNSQYALEADVKEVNCEVNWTNGVRPAIWVDISQ